MLSIIYLQDRVCPLAAASVHRDIKDLVLLVHLFVYLSLSRARVRAGGEEFCGQKTELEVNFVSPNASRRFLLYRQLNAPSLSGRLQ